MLATKHNNALTTPAVNQKSLVAEPGGQFQLFPDVDENIVVNFNSVRLIFNILAGKIQKNGFENGKI
jgi:hypothetical protein